MKKLLIALIGGVFWKVGVLLLEPWEHIAIWLGIENRIVMIVFICISVLLFFVSIVFFTAMLLRKFVQRILPS